MSPSGSRGPGGGDADPERAIEEKTVGELLAEKAQHDPERVFCRHGAVDLTARELDHRVQSTLRALSSLGVGPGDRLATVMGNGFDQIAIMLACLSSGIVWVPINFHQRGPALRHLLADADPAALVVDLSLGKPAANPDELPADLRLISLRPHGSIPGPSLAELEHAAPELESAPRAGPDDVVCISYTSGTTGKPKGVMLTDRMFRACARGVRHTVDAEPDDVMYVWEPLHHNGGNQMVVFALTAPVTLALTSEFSARRFWQEVAETGATHVHYLGGLLQILLKQERTPDESNHRVRVLWGGGCSGEVWRAVERRFGLTPREVYGMTETASITTANLDGPAGSVGRALPYFDVAIGTSDGTPGREEREGEILVRAREPGLLTPGYFGDRVATAKLLPNGSWLRTGDRGRIDSDGYLYFYGRMNDSVRRRGENVSAWEVESVISAHPLVKECAMVGVPAEIGEQDIKVFVQLVDGASLHPAALVEWCGERMAAYQVPRYVSFVEQFEKTPTQRVRKETLARLDVETWDGEQSDTLSKGLTPSG